MSPENMDSFFDNLDQAMDWDTPVQEAAEELFRTLSHGQTGSEHIQRVENLMQVAEHQSRFIDMQRLVASLGDLCCADPAIEAMVSESSILSNGASGTSTGHGACSDEHNLPEVPHVHTKARAQTKSKSKKTKRQTSYKPAPILAPFWERFAA